MIDPMGSPARKAAERRHSIKRNAREKLRRLSSPRAKTVNVFRVPAKERRLLELLYPYPDGVYRPRTRGECVGMSRPCPFVSCRFHLYLDVNETGNIKQNFQVEPEELLHSCSLDIADKGGIALEDVGAAMNMTRERVRQIEVVALSKLERSTAARRLR